MLSIVWIIIKIILIVFLSILGLLLVGILAVLLMPFCYKAQLSWMERKANGTVEISWLLRIFALRAQVRDNQVSTKLLLFGRAIPRSAPDSSERKPKSARKEKKKSLPMDSDTDSISREFKSAGDSESHGQAETKHTEKHAEGQSSDQKNQEKTILDGGTEEQPGIAGKIKRFAGRLLETVNRIRNKIRGLWERMKSGKMKWDQWMEVYHDEKTQNSIRLLKNEGIRILKRIGPRKVRANLRVGLGEPASTGLLLGAAACLMPLYEDAVCLEPDFEEPVLEGDILVKGKVRLGTFVLTAFRVWKDKNLRSLIKKLVK